VTPCRVAHRVDGPQGAPPVVLSSSLGATWQMWDPQVPALTRTNRVVRFDHRGHGASPTPPGPYAIDDMGADVIALLDRLAIETTSFVGLSLGGMVGIWLAAHHPRRIETLVLICTSARPGAEAAWRTRASLVRDEGAAAVAEAVVGRWFTPELAEREPELVSRMVSMVSATSAAGYAACCGALEGLDLRAECRRIVAPTLVVAAAEDPAMPPEQHGRVIGELTPGSRYVELSPAAHLANVEQPEAVTGLLLEHLRASASRVDEGMQG
jgi:3-oxoadipate enol-lactonase